MYPSPNNPTTIPLERNRCSSQTTGSRQMIIFYLTIPFMILALGVAVLPLTWALKHHENWDKSLVTVSDFEEKELELVAA
jgi:hypothetical protein